MLKKIISGGQTGADLAALDVAIKFGFEHGGWIPQGRLTEAGPLPLRYRLKETQSASYPERTRRNIMDSDATLIVARGELTGGTLLTRKIAVDAARPLCLIDLSSIEDFEGAMVVHGFLFDHRIEVLNVAGPRASHDPGIYDDVKIILEAMLYMIYLEHYEQELKEGGIDFSGQELTAIAYTTPDTMITEIEERLSLRQKAAIARLDSSRIWALYFSMLDFVTAVLGLTPDIMDNREQKLGMADYLKLDAPTIEDMVMELVKRLKQKLENEYNLKVIR